MHDHVNALELWATFFACRTWATEVHGKVVMIHCDNQSTIVHILLTGET